MTIRHLAATTALVCLGLAAGAEEGAAPQGQVAQPASPSDVPKPVAGAPISPAYAAAVGKAA